MIPSRNKNATNSVLPKIQYAYRTAPKERDSMAAEHCFSNGASLFDRNPIPPKARTEFSQIRKAFTFLKKDSIPEGSLAEFRAGPKDAATRASLNSTSGSWNEFQLETLERMPERRTAC